MIITKLYLSSLYGKFGSGPRPSPRAQTAEEVLRDFPKATVTPEGHIYAKRYGSKIYECLLCKALKQTRRGRPEYMGPKRFFEVVGEHDPRWSLEASRCPNPRR